MSHELKNVIKKYARANYDILGYLFYKGKKVMDEETAKKGAMEINRHEKFEVEYVEPWFGNQGIWNFAVDQKGFDLWASNGGTMDFQGGDFTFETADLYEDNRERWEEDIELIR